MVVCVRTSESLKASYVFAQRLGQTVKRIATGTMYKHAWHHRLGDLTVRLLYISVCHSSFGNIDCDSLLSVDSRWRIWHTRSVFRFWLVLSETTLVLSVKNITWFLWDYVHVIFLTLELVNQSKWLILSILFLELPKHRCEFDKINIDRV